MATLTFIKIDKVIQVDSPQTEVTIQDLLNQIRDYESDLNNMDLKQIAIATGKDDIGGGNFTGITLNLINDWRIQFEARAGPATESMVVSGGNLIATNIFGNNPIKPSAFTQVTVQLSASPTISSSDDTDIRHLLEAQRPDHTGWGKVIYWNPVSGNDGLTGESPENAVLTFAQAHTLAVTGENDVIFVLPEAGQAVTTITERITISKDFVFLRGAGGSIKFQPLTATDGSPVISITGAGCEISSFEVFGSGTGSDNNISITGNFTLVENIKCQDSQNIGISVSGAPDARIERTTCSGSADDGILINDSKFCKIRDCIITSNTGDGIHLTSTALGDVTGTKIKDNTISNNTGFNLNIGTNTLGTSIEDDNVIASDGGGRLSDNGTSTVDREVAHRVYNLPTTAGSGGRSLDV